MTTVLPAQRYTGEGFKGEKALQLTVTVASIALIFLSLYSLRLQIKHTSLQLQDHKEQKEKQLNKTN